MVNIMNPFVGINSYLETEGNDNPWLASATYEEKDEYRFKGRKEDTSKILSMLQQNECVVCYAASGDGKSSLVNAGLCPAMRRIGLFPIKITFSTDEYNGKGLPFMSEDTSFVDFDKLMMAKINQAVENYRRDFMATHNIDGGYDIIFEKISKYENVDISDSLWWKLRTETIQIPFGVFDYIPVIIFDQFEEIFRATWKAEFFRWLEKLMRETCPNEVAVKYNGIRDDLPSKRLFRIILSMRYEYIGELDYWCSQRFYIPQLLKDRYFLRALNLDQAKQVIVEQSCGDEYALSTIRSKADEILKRLIDRSNNKSDNESNEISAILLSILCFTYYFQIIKKDDLELPSAEDLVRTYYDNTCKMVFLKSPNILPLIEKELVSSDGTRKRIRRKDVDGLNKIVYNVGQKCYTICDLLLTTNLLRKYIINNEEYIEFVHDKIADVIFDRRKERNNQKNKEERRKANYQKFISRQNPLTLGGRRIWDNKTFTFSVDNSRSTSLNNSSSRAEILNDLLQQNKNEDRGIEQLFFDKLFRQTVDTGKISLNFNENCSKDGIYDFEIETERVRGSQQLKIKSIKFFDSNTESFYTVDGFCGIKSEYDKKTGYEIKREYICEGYTSVGIATVEFGDFKEFVFDDFKGGLPQKVMYYDSKRNLCKHIDGNYGVKIEYDDYGNETCRWFLDKDGKITPIYNGVCGLINIFDKQDRIVKQFFVNQKGNPITDDYGFHGVEFIYNETPNELLISESRYIDVNKCLCNNPQGFCIEQFQYDLKGRIIWQHYLNKDRGEVEKKDGVYFYSKLKIGYNELDRPNNIAMYNLSGSIFKVIRYAYDPKGTIKECSFYEIKRSQNGQIERKSKSQDSHVFKIKYEHDNHGFLICQSHFDDDDVSTQDSNGYSNICFIYGCLGELNEYRFYNNQKSDKYPVRHICYKYADDGTCEITQIENEIKAETKAATRKVLGAIKKNKDEQKVEVKDISIFKGVINHRHEFIKGYLDESNDYLPGTPLTVRWKYDIDGNVVEELLFDKNDKKPICDEDGIYGWHVDYDKRTGLKCQMTYLGESGEIANNKYNYAVVKYSNEEYMGGIYFATSYFDKDCQPTRCELGYHKRLETDSSYNDELCKQTIYLDCQGEPCNSTDGYHKQVFYDEQDNNRRVVSFFNSELLPVINESRGFHKREELLTNEGLIANISFYNEKGNLVNVSGGFAKQTFKRYDSFNTLFYYPFIDHDVIRFYDEQDQKVNVEYKGIVGYKFIEPSNDIALIKVVNSKGRIKYWNKSLLWRCINIVWVPIAIALLLIIYPLYSLLKSLYNLCRSKQAAIPESASIIRIAQIFDDVPSGESFIQAPIRQFDVEEGSWIVQWNHWSYNYSQDTATEFEKEFNNSPTRKIITFYNPKEKAFLDVEITSPNIGLRIQDVQVPKNDVLEMMERWEQFKKNSVEI